MKFLHVSDIHLGKRLFGVSLAEDHECVLAQILEIAGREDVDAVLIAGDVYNRAQPQPETITQFSRFLMRLAELRKPTFIVRGNHDGEAQLAYAAPLLADSGLHISEIYRGRMQKIALHDHHGEINIWLLPYIKPLQARRAFPDAGIETYADAVRETIARAEIDPAARNVLVTHHFVTGAATSDSEERSIGGLDQIPPETFEAFDYVALGHLHKSQTLAHGRLRYCGAPLVYSFDECAQQKSATLVTIGEKGAENTFEFIPFQPLHPCRRVEGTLAELAAQPRSEDYIQAILTDETRPLDPIGTLKITYPNLVNLSFILPNSADGWEPIVEFKPATDPVEHFIDFFTAQNKREPSEAQLEIIREIIREGGDDA